jgi:hypothetical protein
MNMHLPIRFVAIVHKVVDDLMKLLQPGSGAVRASRTKPLSSDLPFGVRDWIANHRIARDGNSFRCKDSGRRRTFEVMTLTGGFGN